jgi:signal transduction histidine kinase
VTSAVPGNEAQRLAALYRYDALDAPLQSELEGIARLATLLTGASAAQVNLIDRDRQLTACVIGMEGGQVARSESMCSQSILSTDVTYTPDATQDPRFSANGFVTGRLGSIRMYAAAPLVSPDGLVLGTLCAIDERPRTLTDAQLAGLADLAEQLMTTLELRRHASLLARANTELDAFAGTVAHDLRNPLAAASGYAVDLVFAGSPMAGETLSRLQRTLQRMGGLVEDVLTYARTTQGALLMTEVDLNSVAQAALENLHAPLTRTNGEIRVHHLPVIEADAVQVLQLLQNLMANAILHSGARGRPVAEVAAVQQDEGWVVTVDDNGTGIPLVDRERVFGAFERAVTSAEGTGLGLATCKRIAERHGGHIWIEDSPLGGARMCTQLPASHQADRAEGTPAYAG